MSSVPATSARFTAGVLTALSVAGVLGPVLVNYIREYQIQHGVTTGQAYDITMFIMAGLLIIGFFCNRAIHPLAEPPAFESREAGEPSESAPAA